MTREVPLRRTLESLKKEAKRWQSALRAGDAEARARLVRVLADASDAPALRDVQLALAREHGFSGWRELSAAVERSAAARREAGAGALARYESMADALLEAYRTGTPEAMERHYQYTWHRRRWSGMRTYVQLDLGRRPTGPDDDVEISLDDARHLVAREYGFDDWSALVAYTESPAVLRRWTAKPLGLVQREGPDDWRPIARSRDWEEILELLAQHPTAGLSGQGQLTDDLLADLARVPSLTGLGLSGCREITDAGLRHLARLPALQYLDLSETAITDEGLDVLRHLPQLRTLSLAWTAITEPGMAALANCDALERVNLFVIPQEGERWPARAGDAAIRALAGKRALKYVQVALTDAGLPLLHGIPAFRTWDGSEARLALVGPKWLPNQLSLRGPFSDAGMQALRGLEGLMALDIDNGSLEITAAALDPLASLPHLEALGVDAKDDWMPALARIPRLRHLGIQDTVAGDDGFVALSRSGSIEYIWGRRCHNLRRRGFAALAGMPALRGLSVSCLNVDEVGIAALPSFPSLRELMPMDVPDAGYRHIGRCLNLESLILMYCRDTTDEATEHITGLDRLTDYFNSYTTITDRTPELLAGMPSLERITFDTCHNLTDAGVARLARLPRLREVGVSGNGVTARVKAAFPQHVKVSVGG